MNKILKTLISILITITILFFLFRKVDYNFQEMLSITNVMILFISLFIYLIIKVINTFRYSQVYLVAPSLKLFSLLSFSNLMLNILPFRVGEFSYIQGLKKYFNISYKKSSAGLIILRLIDYIIVYILFLISSFFIGIKLQNNIVGKISIFFLISLIIAFFVFYFILFKQTIKIKNKRIKNILLFIKEGFYYFKKISKKTIVFIILFSFSYWIMRIFLTYVIFTFLDIKISFITIIFISLTLMLIGLVPIHTIGGFGIFEAGWTYFLILFGFTYEDILPKILTYHFLILLPAIIFGIIGYVYLKLRR